MLLLTTHVHRPNARNTPTAPSTPRSPAATWKAADQFDRLAAAYELIHSRGGATFTLRLGLDALVQVTGSIDPTRVMSRRIGRAFARAGRPMPLLAFSLEVTSDERDELHLHGAIDPGQTPWEDIKNILRDAAGTISGRPGSRQILVKPFDMNVGGPLGWANYTRRGFPRTRRVLGQDRVTYMPDALRRLASAAWDGSRQIRSS